MIVKGKNALVVGVANKNSIAWGIAQVLAENGANVALSYQNERLEKRVRGLAEEYDPPLHCVQLDATNDDEIKASMADLGEHFDGKLDILVHSIAYAKKEDLEGGMIETSSDGFKMAQEISAYTLIALVRGAKPLMDAAGGGSVVALTYLGSVKVVPNYNVMGIAKASLESTIRYLAWDLGKQNIRVNGVSAGPMNTLAARGISGFSTMYEKAADRAPMGRNVTLEEVGNASLFLLSPLASGITGEILYVDAGFHIMGM